MLFLTGLSSKCLFRDPTGPVLHCDFKKMEQKEKTKEHGGICLGAIMSQALNSTLF